MHPTTAASGGELRVVVVDADDLVCQTVAALLSIGDRLDVVGIAGEVEAAIEIVAATRPDVVIVDPRLPDLDGGLAFILRLHAVAPGVRVLVSCSADVLDRVAGSSGVDGCLRKTFRPGELTAAIVAASRPTTA